MSRVRFKNTDDLELEKENHTLGKNAKVKDKNWLKSLKHCEI